MSVVGVEVVLTVVLVAAAGPALLGLGAVAGRRWTSPDPLRRLMGYQGMAVPFAIAVWLLVRVLVPSHSDVLRIGDFAAPVESLGWLGVGSGETWGPLLITIGGIVVAVTAVVLWLQVGRGSGMSARGLVRVLPWAIVLAALNATNEELIFRVALVEGTSPAVASGVVSALLVAAISAVTFGVPHWFGHPRGPIGAVLAAFLGWLTCMATLQTAGIAWAWLLHLALDVVILTTVLGAARAGVSR